LPLLDLMKDLILTRRLNNGMDCRQLERN